MSGLVKISLATPVHPYRKSCYFAEKPGDPEGGQQAVIANQRSGSFVDREIARNWQLVEQITASDTTGKTACYFLYVPRHRKAALIRALDSDSTIDLCQFGDVIASNYGNAPSTETIQLIKNRFGIDV